MPVSVLNDDVRDVVDAAMSDDELDLTMDVKDFVEEVGFNMGIALDENQIREAEDEVLTRLNAMSKAASTGQMASA